MGWEHDRVASRGGFCCVSPYVCFEANRQPVGSTSPSIQCSTSDDRRQLRAAKESAKKATHDISEDVKVLGEWRETNTELA